ncbi:MAG: DUF4349 domain-containing protein [Bacillota bacterium]
MLNKSKISRFLIFLLIGLLSLVVGCQGANNRNHSQEAQVSESVELDRSSSKLANRSNNGNSEVESANYNQQESVDRKIIKESNLTIITKDLSNITEEIDQIIKNYDGYLANSNQWHNDRKNYRFTIKIPQKNFQTTIEQLKKLGTINREQISSRDITQEYIDLKARLKNFKAQEKRYLQLLDRAENVDDILKVEKELNRIRRNIEQLQGKLNYYNNKINFSTINVTFKEPQPIMNNNSWGIINSFKDSVQEFVASINSIIIISGSLLPWLILGLLFLFILYKIYQKLN